jgi:hypothetical protein
MGHYASEMMSESDAEFQERRARMELNMLKRLLALAATDEEEAKLAVSLAEKIHYKIHRM